MILENLSIETKKKKTQGEFPGGPVVGTLVFSRPWYDPCQGTKILQAAWHSKKKKKKTR